MQVVEKFSTTATPDAIWKVLADVEHWPNWIPTVLEVKPLGNTELRVGAQYRVTQPKLRPAVRMAICAGPDISACIGRDELSEVFRAI